MSIGNKIHLNRKKKNYSQEKLAELIGVSRQTIYKWEMDYVVPTTENLKALTELFGVEPIYFFQETFPSDVSTATKELTALATPKKTNKKLIIALIINTITFFITTFATICAGFIALSANKGDSVVHTFYVDTSIFVILLILSVILLGIEIFLIIRTVQIIKHYAN